MKIKYIEFKNIASYGNKTQRIEFKDEATVLNLVVGKNGSGKSTISNAIVFALYGKVDDMKLNDLPNRINKGLETKISLLCGNRDVIIERKLQPKDLKVTINDIEIDIAGKTSIEDFLEKEIYKIPYQVFKNVIILSINDFKSFLTMTPTDKRSVIDKIFGFSIINDMQINIKERKKITNDELTVVEAELNAVTDSINHVNSKISDLHALDSKKNKKKLKILQETLIDLEDKQEKLNANLVKFADKSVDIIAAKDDELSAHAMKNSRLNEATAKLKLYKSSKCPTCESSLITEWHDNNKEKYKQIVKVVPEDLVKIEEKVNKLDIALNGIKSKEKESHTRAGKLSANISNVNRNINELSSSLEINTNDEYENLNSLIKDFKKKESIKMTKNNELVDERHFIDVLDLVIGDEGIKGMAIQSVLPILNNTITAMLKKMHLNFSIKFDESFKVNATHLGEEIHIGSLSTGERKKVDFVVVIAIIKILKMRFPQLNILFLDEIFSSVDADGIYNILTILNKVIKENGINTFVINHTVLPHEIFDNKIEIYKENGFSKMNIEKIE